MTTRFARIGTFTLLLSLAMFAAVRAAHAQTVEPPPVKMGLWQTETSSAMTGMENSPMARAGGGKHKTVTQGCLTPETWKSEFQKLHNEDDSDCKISNTHQDSYSLSFDRICTSERFNTNAHIEAQFDDSEHMHGTGKVQISGAAIPQGMTMDISLSSHYLGASCGDVKPGEGKVIHHE